MSSGANHIQVRASGPLVTRAWRVALVVGGASFLLFAAAAHKLLLAGAIEPALRESWNHANSQMLLSGQWPMFVMINLLHLIPGCGPSSMVVITITATALAQGLLARDLIQRGWSPSLAASGILVTSANPVIVIIATSGAPMIFYTIVVGLLILAIDRVEAIADTRALILLGVGVAAMFVLWPNAIYWVAPTLIVLPLAFREMNSISAAVALFTIALLPGFIVVSSMILSGAMFGRPPAEAIAVWSAILHGAAPQEVLHSAWLASFGGQFTAAFVALALMCATIAPRSWLIIWRLGLNRREQTQPATALAALLLPPISGALATYFWHLDAPIVVVACSLAAVASWTATASLRHGERAAWVLLSLAGTSFGWAAPLLWQDSGLAHLRHILLT